MKSALLPFLLASAITWTGFTKNNHLRSCIRYANALPSVIIFIRTLVAIDLCQLEKVNAGQ